MVGSSFCSFFFSFLSSAGWFPLLAKAARFGSDIQHRSSYRRRRRFAVGKTILPKHSCLGLTHLPIGTDEYEGRTKRRFCGLFWPSLSVAIEARILVHGLEYLGQSLLNFGWCHWCEC